MKALDKKAVSIIEYIVLVLLVLAAFVVMQNYVQRGFFAGWAKAGRSFAFGRQYDPQKTIECSFDEASNRWYDDNCFKYYDYNYYYNVGGSSGCDAGCKEDIVTKCLGSYCNNLNPGTAPSAKGSP